MEHGFPVLNQSLCMDHGACHIICPADAIKLILAPYKGIPADLLTQPHPYLCDREEFTYQLENGTLYYCKK